jgi:predicted flap endonuclease-1-like 5' DNA nuclease
MNIPCILIPALVGLICGILGYLIGKMASKGNESDLLSLQAELDACRANTKNLNAKITSLEADLAAKLNSSASAQSFVGKTASEVAFDAALAATVFGKKIKKDDLKIIEGIGPKIEELYHKAGIKTWLALSETPTSKSQAILDEAGENYAIHNPGTWARQAKLAYEGKWQELKEWQDALDGGKE